jgi:hypothetical protein
MNRSKLKLTTFLFAVSLYWIDIDINWYVWNDQYHNERDDGNDQYNGGA